MEEMASQIKAANEEKEKAMKKVFEAEGGLRKLNEVRGNDLGLRQVLELMKGITLSLSQTSYAPVLPGV